MIILFHIFVVAVLQLSHVFASSNLAYKVGRGHPTGSWGLLEENRQYPVHVASLVAVINRYKIGDVRRVISSSTMSRCFILVGNGNGKDFKPKDFLFIHIVKNAP